MDALESTLSLSKKAVKGSLPRKESDLSSLAVEVSKSWKNEPRFVLFWTTQAEFALQAENFKNLHSSSKEAKGGRSPITQSLKKIDVNIEKGVKYVKGYIKDKFEDSAIANYAKYGIEKNGGAYMFPKDRDKRITALSMLINSLEADGFADKKYGKAYFENIKTEYDKLVSDVSSATKNISTHVDSKKSLRDTIEKTLMALRSLIQANYPDSFGAQLRIFGFQKEKY
ncbi:MAG: hypothetical protein ACKVOU_02485 [Cytophagales bacterium]